MVILHSYAKLPEGIMLPFGDSKSSFESTKFQMTIVLQWIKLRILVRNHYQKSAHLGASFVVAGSDCHLGGESSASVGWYAIFNCCFTPLLLLLVLILLSCTFNLPFLLVKSSSFSLATSHLYACLIGELPCNWYCQGICPTFFSHWLVDW